MYLWLKIHFLKSRNYYWNYLGTLKHIKQSTCLDNGHLKGILGRYMALPYTHKVLLGNAISSMPISSRQRYICVGIITGCFVGIHLFFKERWRLAEGTFLYLCERTFHLFYFLSQRNITQKQYIFNKEQTAINNIFPIISRSHPRNPEEYNTPDDQNNVWTLASGLDLAAIESCYFQVLKINDTGLGATCCDVSDTTPGL